MSVQQPESNALPPLRPSAAASSLKSRWSSLPHTTRLVTVVAVVAFMVFALVIGISTIGLLGSSIFGGSIESQVSSRGSFVEQQFLKSITDLKVTNAGRDELRLRFKLSSVNGSICGPCRFTVTMANSDGEVIHYFTSQPVFQLW